MKLIMYICSYFEKFFAVYTHWQVFFLTVACKKNQCLFTDYAKNWFVEAINLAILKRNCKKNSYRWFTFY